MSRRTKKQEFEKRYREIAKEDERELRKYEVILLLRKGILGFAIGFGLYIMYALSDGDDIIWLHACALGLLSMGIPHGWQCVGGFLSEWYLVFNFPFMVIAFLLRGTAAIFVGFITYPVALLRSLIQAQRKGSKWTLFFSILLYFFIFLVALFFIGTSL